MRAFTIICLCAAIVLTMHVDRSSADPSPLPGFSSNCITNPAGCMKDMPTFKGPSKTKTSGNSNPKGDDTNGGNSNGDGANGGSSKGDGTNGGSTAEQED